MLMFQRNKSLTLCLDLFLKLFPPGFDKTWWHTVVQMLVMFSTRTLQSEDKYIFLVYAHGRCDRTMVSSYYHSIISLSRYYSKMKPVRKKGFVVAFCNIELL